MVVAVVSIPIVDLRDVPCQRVNWDAGLNCSQRELYLRTRAKKAINFNVYRQSSAVRKFIRLENVRDILPIL